MRYLLSMRHRQLVLVWNTVKTVFSNQPAQNHKGNEKVFCVASVTVGLGSTGRDFQCFAKHRKSRPFLGLSFLSNPEETLCYVRMLRQLFHAARLSIFNEGYIVEIIREAAVRGNRCWQNKGDFFRKGLFRPRFQFRFASQEITTDKTNNQAWMRIIKAWQHVCKTCNGIYISNFERDIYWTLHSLFLIYFLLYFSSIRSIWRERRIILTEWGRAICKSQSQTTFFTVTRDFRCDGVTLELIIRACQNSRIIFAEAAFSHD